MTVIHAPTPIQHRYLEMLERPSNPAHQQQSLTALPPVPVPTLDAATTEPHPVSTGGTNQHAQVPVAPSCPRPGPQDASTRKPTPAPTCPDPVPNLTQPQSKSSPTMSRMQPHIATQHHPAFHLLLHYATTGCPVDCGQPWTMQHLSAAVARGPHPSARSPDARACLRAETLEKVSQGHARLIPWSELSKNPPPNLKISPLAAVPHKSRRFRAILDLSFQLCLGGLHLPSVNSATRPQASAHAMRQLGSVLPWLIAAMAAAAPDNGPIFFAKWDIKDGFWHLVVHPDDAWNFCYVLPSEPGEEPMIVVPLCLQMGWCKSPAFFCSASETARDIAQELLDNASSTLPPHPPGKPVSPTNRHPTIHHTHELPTTPQTTGSIC